MRKRNVKRAAMVLLCAGTVFQFGGCFATVGRFFFQSIIPFSFLEWVTDNDAIFDLFQDGAN